MQKFLFLLPKDPCIFSAENDDALMRNRAQALPLQVLGAAAGLRFNQQRWRLAVGVRPEYLPLSLTLLLCRVLKTTSQSAIR